MRILITGATGFVGRYLGSQLAKKNHEILALTRNPSSASHLLSFAEKIYPWNAENEIPQAEFVQDVDAIIHLAGEPVAPGRWTKQKKERIYFSRVKGTKGLIQSLASASISQPKPRVLISASAIGIYGDRANEVLTEDSAAGKGFLAEVCQDWEHPVRTHSIPDLRTVSIRIGLVLGQGGGALSQLLPLFRAGLGGAVGPGTQWVSWIHLEDLASVIQFILSNNSIQGVVNAVSPNPVSNAEFSKSIGKALHRPSLLHVPSFALKLALGEMASALLSSQRVIPQVLLDTGFSFQFPEIEPALESVV